MYVSTLPYSIRKITDPARTQPMVLMPSGAARIRLRDAWEQKSLSAQRPLWRVSQCLHYSYEPILIIRTLLRYLRTESTDPVLLRVLSRAWLQLAWTIANAYAELVCWAYTVDSIHAMAESSMQAGPSPLKSQYHHFVPRLLLKNFADFKNPGNIVPKTSRKAKSRPPKPQKLTVLDLESGDIRQGDVSDTFGIVDMYRDFNEVDRDQYKLEKQLSKLEGDAGEILARVKKTYDSGKEEIQLERKHRDLLRRFLFIMMYRNSSFIQRFEKSKNDYDCNDRADMLAYMDTKGFQTPRDVWFANIRAFLEVDLSQDLGDMSREITERAYPPDAQWFFAHIQAFFLTFCTPKMTSDEFIMTQNAYSIFEGPHYADDESVWTDYHRFAPVSPKIMIVLRSNLLPHSGVEGGEAERRRMLEQIKAMHPNPQTAGSCLEDLPVAKAGNNYSRVVDGIRVPLPTKMSKDKHVFKFPFFSLNHEHVQKINTICLENASGTKAIVYKSRENLRTAIEKYLTDKTQGFKYVHRPFFPPKLLRPHEKKNSKRMHLIDNGLGTQIRRHISSFCTSLRRNWEAR